MITSMMLSLLCALGPDSSALRDTVYQLDPIVVVGTREPARLSRTVNSAIVLSPSRVAAAPEDNLLANLASNFASVSLSSTRSVGYGLGTIGQGQLFIRGLGFSPNVGILVLIDGRPDIAGLFGHPLPDTYQKAGLSSADLIKGGAGTLYGSNAMAGVLDLTSFYRPDRERFSHVSLEGGSYGTLDGSVQHSQRFGEAIVAGWYEYLQSDNQGANNEFFSRAGGLRVQIDSVSGWNLFAAARVTSFFFADPGPDYNLRRSTGDVVRTGVTLGADRNWNEIAFSARLYNSYGEHSFSDGFNSVDRNNGVDLFARFRPSNLPWLIVSGGGSVSNLGGSAHDGTPFTLTGNFDNNEYAGLLQTELHPDSTITLIAGGRVIDNKRYGSHAVYQLGSVIRPGHVGSFKLSVATAYRNPTVMESQLFLISNPDSLRPEEGTFYEVGYFGKLARSVSLETSVFWRNGKNLITTVLNPNPPPGVLFENSGTFRHSGWEATLTFANNRLRVSPSFMHLNQKSFLNSIPEDKFALSAGWQERRWSASLETVSAFRPHSDSAGANGSTQPLVLKDYTLVNLGARLNLTGYSSLSFRCENLFDTKYQIVFGYPMPGTTIRLGLDFQI